MYAQKIFSLITLCSSLNCVYFYAMDLPPYLKYPDKYAEFRLTRSYGTLNFGGLPKEVIERHIKPYFYEPIITIFKQRLLNYKYQLRSENNEEQLLDSLSLSCNNIFRYHDGKYTVVPDGVDYSLWSGNTGEIVINTISYDNQEEEYIKLLSHHKEQSEIQLYCPLDQYEQINEKSFFLRGKTRTSLWSFVPINSYMFSSDGNWLVLYSTQPCPKIRFIEIEEHKLHAEIEFYKPIIAWCSAHHSSLFAICDKEGLSLITPETIGNSCTLFFESKSIQFSPNDKYLIIFASHKIALYDVNIQKIAFDIRRESLFASIIQKVLFAPDSKKIAIACKDGIIWFWDIIGEAIANPYQACWCDWEMAYTFDREPELMWSEDNILFSLDPIEGENSKFIVRNAIDGRCLASYNFCSNDPVVMGLTKDGRAVVFVERNGRAHRLDLYDEQDYKNIEFIKQKADLYRLCCLWNICKEVKVEQIDDYDLKAPFFVKVMKFWIQDIDKNDYSSITQCI